MSLTQSQKKFIKKNIKHKSVEAIASILHVAPQAVNSYIRNRWGEEKYKIQTPKMPSIQSFSFLIFVKTNWWILLLLAGLVLICYMNTFSAAFVSDDNGMMLNVPHYTLQGILTEPTQFLRRFIYFVAFQIGGYNPFLFRLSNIIFHLGATWLVFIILTLMSKRSVAIVAAILFAVHPILIESVTWISGGVYVQYGFFFLLSFVFYILSVKNNKFFWVSVFCYGLAVFSSEKAVVLCLVFLVYELLLGDIKKNWKRIIVFFLVALVFIVAYLNPGTIAQRIATSNQKQEGVDNPLLQIPIALTAYWQLLLFPNDLTIYHSELVFSQMEYVMRLIVTIVFGAGIVYSFKKNRFICFWLCFFLIPLLPTLTPFRVSWIVAERYVYLSSLSIFVLTAIFLVWLAKIKKASMYIYTFFAIVVIVLMLRTIVRNSEWQNEDVLWVATAKSSPSSPVTHNNMGDVYGRHGDHENAAKEFMRAIEINPQYADAYHNLGNAYMSLGKLKEARKSYEKAATLNPRLWQSYQRLAALDFEEKKFLDAQKQIEKAIALDPTDLNLQLNYALVIFNAGEKEKAIILVGKILNANPANQEIQQLLKQMQESQ